MKSPGPPSQPSSAPGRPRPAGDAHATGGSTPCTDLRRMFDDLTREPMPDRLLDLCDKLEDAFRRGELYSGAAKIRRV